MQLDVQQFEAQRPLLFGIAYRMLGMASEAEDVVQDAYVRVSTSGVAEIQSPRAYLSSVVTRLCLDRLKSARAVREQYIGPWLPEPVLHQPADGAGEAQAEQADTVSMALLLLMEQLSPLERAIFVLHSAFDFSFEEVGAMVGRSAATCRQSYHRARTHLDAKRPRFRVSAAQQQALVATFLAAARDGDIATLTAMLTEDVVALGDGGGVVSAARRPVHGAVAVARMFAGLTAQAFDPQRPALTFGTAWINSAPGLLTWEGDQLTTVLVFACSADHITAIHNIRNPAKLAHLARCVAQADVFVSRSSIA